MLEYFDATRPRLRIGGMDYEETLRTFRSPVYVYDAEILKKKYQKLRNALPPFVEIFYAVKSNPNLSVIRTLTSLGAGCDVASLGELNAMEKLKVPAEKVVFTGPGKSDDEIELAIRLGIFAFNCESENEIIRIQKIAEKLKTTVRIGLRINTDYAIKESIHLIGGTAAKKFGIDESLVVDVIQRNKKSPNIEFIGVHIFNATQVLDHRELVANTENILRLSLQVARETGMPLSYLDIGGGLGIPYDEDDVELDVVALGYAFNNLRQKYSVHEELKNTRWIIEPGRYLSGECGVFLTTIVDIKESRKVKFLITDAGINQFLRPALVHQNHPCRLANKFDRAATDVYRIDGPLCTSLDCLGTNVHLPKAEIGDHIVFFNAGAYGFSESMLFFLSHPIPAEIMIKDGKMLQTRKRIEPLEYISQCDF